MKTLGSPAMNSGGAGKKRTGLLDSASASSQQSSPVFNKDNPNPYVRWEHAMMYSNTSLPCLITQLLPILVIFPFRSIIIWFLIAAPWVELMKRGFGRLDALLFAMIISRVLLGLGAPLLGIAAKWLIIGKYKPGRNALWSTYYLKWWLVEQIINIMGKGWFRDDLPIVGSTLVRLYYILMGAKIGNNVKVQNNVAIYTGVECEDDVFLGPSMVFTNVTNPRSAVVRRGQYAKTVVKKGASIGANATIVCGHDIGEYAFIGAGAVVTKNVPAYALMVGNPARQIGWMSQYGHRLEFNAEGLAICPESNQQYKLTNGQVNLQA
jgi:UDP-2-acetamido-3-amino-2,3-dideoxy-glucuronate N-acetyltransferase